MPSLDVLVIESHDGAARLQAQALEAAGHRVHRCFPEDESGFPCRGIAQSCPLDSGMDAVLLVRKGVSPRPSYLESGTSCAIRAEVPVVEDGVALLDPFDGWIAERVTCGVVEACEAAAANSAQTTAPPPRRL